MKFPFLILTVLLLAPWAKLWAELGLPREAYGVWDRSGYNTVAQYPFAFEFFNKWAAELIPATAGGGFCILHQGLDASDKVKYPAASFGGQPWKKPSPAAPP
jgi:hypothetical protein